MKFFFVGERRSETAQKNNWTWVDGRLAAKPLFEALEAMGVDPRQQSFYNLWSDKDSKVSRHRVRRIRDAVEAGATLVALGQKVARELTSLGIKHIQIVHPAARGRIRKRHRYIKHVTSALGDQA